MKKTNPLLFAVMICFAASSAEAQVDLFALERMLPSAYEAVKAIEAERGQPFSSWDELKIAMATDDFRNKKQRAEQAFCAKPENALVLLCYCAKPENAEDLLCHRSLETGG